MIVVQINDIKRQLVSLDRNTIYGSIQKCIVDNLPIHLSVYIEFTDINIVLQSGDCPKARGSGRQINSLEEKLFNEWDALSLNLSRINPENLLAFLEKIKCYL